MVNGKNDKNTNADGREGTRGRPVPAPVSQAETAEYVFALLRSVIELTRGRAGMTLATYLIEMAALEMAALHGRQPPHGGADNRPTI